MKSHYNDTDWQKVNTEQQKSECFVMKKILLLIMDYLQDELIQEQKSDSYVSYKLCMWHKIGDLILCFINKSNILIKDEAFSPLLSIFDT